MATGPTQRHYTAPCPGCGAPVEFISAQSTHAVCDYCRSTVVRKGEVLARTGRMAELFDDHSPLQLRATGTWEGKSFTLIGCMQFHGEEGGWTEWNVFFSDASRATLSEDNGAYVFSRPVPVTGGPLPVPERLPLGANVGLGGKRWSVAAHMQVHLAAAEGELPDLPPQGQPFTVVELRAEDGQVLSIDYGGDEPEAEIGRAVRLEELALQGLKDESVKRESGGRKFSCPHCGAPVQVRLDTSKSITCPSCRSVIDLTRGIGAEVLSATQNEPVRPLIALGKIGQFEGVSWQVVGFQHRMGQEPGDDEQFGWDEYLLYNQQKGFVFLVDASDGWSLVRPATGAPKTTSLGINATYLGTTYVRTSGYRAETTYVAGEFYWPVERGQHTENVDYTATKGRGLLSSEKSGREITWSYGSRVTSDTVAKAFDMQDEAERFKRDEVGPFVAGSGAGCGTIALILVMLFIALFLLGTCSSSGSYTRSSGGSFGGFSSGGSHK